MNLTAHFTLAELTWTNTGLPNDADADETCRLRALCSAGLQPFREKVGRLQVTSGFRSLAVNNRLRELGKSASLTSQHLLGEAADVVPLDMPLMSAWGTLVQMVRAGLPIDQAIIYTGRPTGGGWIHLSHSATRCRRELLEQPLAKPGQYPTWKG